MPDNIYPKRLIRSWRAHLLAFAMLAAGVLVAGCGGSSGNLTTTTAGAASTSARTVAAGDSTTSSGSTEPSVPPSGLAFARCMRSSGVPNFPDPSPGRGLLFNGSGANVSSPAFKAAQAKCQKLLPGGGPARPGTRTHPTAQTLAKLVRVARCMRRHGVPDFPDPRTSVPSNPFPSGQGIITDYDGAILLFPSTLNMQSPAYTQAVSACGTLAGKLGRGPHS